MDKKAKKILTSTFWSAQGWKSNRPSYAGEDFEYAKSHGVMFDPLNKTHDELIEQITRIHTELTAEQVGDAFLHSLSTRRVELRSALSSFALTQDLIAHTYNDSLPTELRQTSACAICNEAGIQSDDAYTDHDLNVLNFERIKWGGVRLNWLTYISMDLDLFMREEIGEVTSEDVEILKQMLKNIEECAPEERARKLEKRWKTVLSSNPAERDRLMEIWGYAGILKETELPRIGKPGDTDFISMSGWQGQDRYSKAKIQQYFGKWL
ncbi:hypothetical protein [Saccharibacillus sp. JS10]|uniref:hypothetical protein n=1 Tax=Saccharibacillus sp. JS10 TaxID=2950552 RepID=UPI00210B0A14|nr:hypothetical protein [Saccharibacillus sp. JS10]MCQ4085537.1 hypothetical protein [Saccharibacillus sp. JS10]